MKYLVALVTIFFLSSVAVLAQLDPQENLNQFGESVPSFRNQVGDDAGTTLASTVGRVVNAFLAILGIIFIILFIYGGFTWMKSVGNEDEVQRAKRILRAAVIGLIITLLSAAIYIWVRSAILFGGGGSQF